MAVINNLPNGFPILHYEAKQFTNKTVGANTYFSDTFSVAKPGYKAIGLAGYYCQNSASGGVNSTYCLFSAVYLIPDGTDRVFARVRNVTNSQAKVDIVVLVLYEKVSA